jgi:tetratricopeptide (TPR) repeat protein
MTENTTAPDDSRIDRLLDAIDLIKEDKRQEAYDILRSLIAEDGNFEHAWLWMAVVVKSLDQAIVCLDNVLRVNPNNTSAAGALYRLRETEMLMEKRREQLRNARNLSLISLWVLTVALLYVMLFTFLGNFSVPAT